MNLPGGTEGSPVSPPSFRSSSFDGTTEGSSKGLKEKTKVGIKDGSTGGVKDGLKGVPKGVSPLPGMSPAHHQVTSTPSSLNLLCPPTYSPTSIITPSYHITSLYITSLIYCLLCNQPHPIPSHLITPYIFSSHHTNVISSHPIIRLWTWCLWESARTNRFDWPIQIFDWRSQLFDWDILVVLTFVC